MNSKESHILSLASELIFLKIFLIEKTKTLSVRCTKVKLNKVPILSSQTNTTPHAHHSRTNRNNRTHSLSDYHFNYSINFVPIIDSNRHTTTGTVVSIEQVLVGLSTFELYTLRLSSNCEHEYRVSVVLSVLWSPQTQCNEVKFINQLNKHFEFDHNIFLWVYLLWS